MVIANLSLNFEITRQKNMKQEKSRNVENVVSSRRRDADADADADVETIESIGPDGLKKKRERQERITSTFVSSLKENFCRKFFS